MIYNVTDGCINAALAIWDDLLGRKGIGNELEACDEEIQQEIKREMAGIIAKCLYLESNLEPAERREG